MVLFRFDKEHKIEEVVRCLMELRNAGCESVSFDMIEKDTVLVIKGVKNERQTDANLF